MTADLQELGRRVSEACREAYFVGGCVRDMLRGEPTKDVDLALVGDTYAVGRALVRAYGGHVFWLREEEGVVRVVLPGLGDLHLDLCPLRGTVEEDLLARDLTVNAMAQPVAGGLRPEAPVLDPTGGQSDLAARIVRFPRPSAPEQDPLRTLRALRFRWKLGFTLPDETASRLRECVPLLERVSTERIRDELFQLLALPQAADALAECLTFGTGRWLTGSPGETGDLRPAESLRAVQALLPRVPEELRCVLEVEISPPRRRRELLLWAAALAPWSPPLDRSAVTRHLALSNEERQLIVKGLEAAPGALELLRRWPVAGRERYRLFRKAGPAGPEAVLLAGAVHGWNDDCAALLEEALRRHLSPEPPLITGVDLMQALELKPGPRVGHLLNEVEEARADGLLHTPEEALSWLREHHRD